MGNGRHRCGIGRKSPYNTLDCDGQGLSGNPICFTASAVDAREQLCLNPLMQIESLKVFCDLVESESFTKAAQINQVTQSAVSQTLSAFERIFKSLLVERSKKQFRLTREGHVVYECSKEILQTYQLLESKLMELKDVISGSIRVATIYSIGLHDLPPYIKKFMQSYPTMAIHVEYRHASEVYEDVQSNIVDLGLVAYPVKDAKLEIVPLHKDPLVLICHPQHPFAKLKAIKLKQLADQKMIGFTQNEPTRKALDKILRQKGVQVMYASEFDNVETIKRAVEIDAGIAIVPEVTVKQEISKKSLATVEIEGGQLFRPLAAIHKKDRVLSPGMKQFLEVLKGAE
jgi:DNA-binding transcriptional LysR family regulator